ncbi:MAG: hypothetical protein EZS28_002306 [Streblomastix strix]|uniref:Uncharacterized protein n=1 Tax=Streblomastix strix TaxID=222440 RepID=A0A5J4X4M2_9EUKA|nr:MAG: hypothetical protein EZS28_002299 [Streblomastix strix]KAA6402175.1 MAG: hypothetical protein EZS28_002306 [Streblomastix strix]
MTRIIFDNRAGSRTRTPLKLSVEIIPEIQIMEKFNPDPIVFENVTEFKQYLALNKAEMEKMSTLKLNMQFKIKGGYRIIRLKGQISLRLWPKEQKLERQSETIDQMQNLDQRLESLIAALLSKNIITEEDLN